MSAAASARLAPTFDKRVRFAVDAPAPAAAALGDQTYKERVRANDAGQPAVLGGAPRKRGMAMLPSQANVVLVGVGPQTTTGEAALVARGVVPRPAAGDGDLLRVTVGAPDETRALPAAFDAVLA